MSLLESLSQTSSFLLFVGFFLIIIELITGGVTSFFLAIVGLVFIFTSLFVHINDIKDPVYISFFLFISTFLVFFLVFFLRTKKEKEKTVEMSDDNYVGDCFLLEKELKFNSRITNIRVFGLSWIIISHDDEDIPANTEVLITKVGVGLLTVTKLNK